MFLWFQSGRQCEGQLCSVLDTLGAVEDYTRKDLSYAVLLLCHINFLFVCLFDFQNSVSLCSLAILKLAL